MSNLPPWLDVLYPFEERSFSTDLGQLNYVDEGSGESVIMLHGNPTWSFMYRDLIMELRDAYRCLALDNLGCGLSDKPQDHRYTLAGHVDRACEWIDAVEPGNFHLVVHDWGGAIGMGVANRLADRVKSITLMNTAAFRFPTIPKRIAACRIPGLGKVMVRGGNAFAAAATRMTTVEPLSEAVAAGYLYPYDSWANRVAVHGFVKDIPMRRSHPTWKTLVDIEEGLEQWRDKKVQIIWGMKDWCFHEGILNEWIKRLPEVSVHRLENASHYLMEDAGPEVTELIRVFLGA